MTWSKSGRARQPEDGEVGVEEGHHLGDPVPAQRQLSAQQSCDVAQGFYFSRPVPASDLTAVLRSKALPGGDAAGEVHAATRSTCAAVAGNVHLTNSCRIDGWLHAGGRVAMDSTATIGGELVAGGDVTV
ncbi:MAG TPA: hypothetical protein PKE47_16630, partial [Verrucomicrobiota bacterium]|nr:hypothetical protein [Verrucomicrobiota bacterium]